MDFDKWKSIAQNRMDDKWKSIAADANFDKWKSDTQTKIGDLNNWKSYAADTLSNLQNLDSLAEQDAYIKSPHLNVSKQSSLNLDKGEDAVKESRCIVSSMENEVISASSSTSSFLDEKLSNSDEQDSESKSIDVKQEPKSGEDKALVATEVNQKAEPDNEWSLLDLPWQEQTKEIAKIDLEKADESTIQEESNKTSETKRTQQMSMLSVVASLMQEISSPHVEPQQPPKKIKSSIEDKMKLSYVMKTLDISDDEFSSDEEFETDFTSLTPVDTSKKDKTVWFDVFDENNNALVFNKPSPQPTTPASKTTSLLQTIPLFQKLSQNKTIQSLTQSFSIRPNPTTHTHQHETSPTNSTTSSEDMYLSSSSIMNLEESLEWQRLQRQHTTHPIWIIKDNVSRCLNQYGFVLLTLCIALFVYFYSRTRVIDRVA